MNTMNFDELIHLVRAIVIDTEGHLPASDTQNAWELVDAGEPGVALENLCTQLFEYDIVVPQALLGRIAAAGEAMGLDADLWTDLTAGA